MEQTSTISVIILETFKSEKIGTTTKKNTFLVGRQISNIGMGLLTYD